MDQYDAPSERIWLIFRRLTLGEFGLAVQRLRGGYFDMLSFQLNTIEIPVNSMW